MGNRKKNRNSILGNRIKELREMQNLTQIELASKVYKTDSTIRAWESGKSEPDTETLILLSKIFNTSIEYLIGINSNNNSSNEKQKELLFIAFQQADPITQKNIATLLGINISTDHNKLTDDMAQTIAEVKLPTKRK